ncbi:FGGY-family carbohydrate kinase, partial [Kaarinaea lacus]
HQSTGLRLTAHYGASKLHWCLQHLPAVKQAFDENRLAWGPMASFMNFRLTREKHNLVDPANASRTLLWHIKTRDWDPQLLSLFEVPSKPLPRCVPTRYEFGTLEVANRSIPLRVVTGDQSAALFAYGMPQVDTAYINIGTGAFVQKPTLNKIVHAPRLLSSIVLHDQTQTHYVVECTVNGAGSALTQVEEQMGMSCSYAEEQFNTWLVAADNPPLFLNGISGLGTPFWVPNFPSRFQGDGEDWEKIVAVAESIIFLLKINLEELDKVTSGGLEKIIVSGGLALSDALCQKLADLTQVPLYRPLDSEATARGIAFLLADYPSEWPESQRGDWLYPQSNQGLAKRYYSWCQAMQVVLRDYPSTVTE